MQSSMSRLACAQARPHYQARKYVSTSVHTMRIVRVYDVHGRLQCLGSSNSEARGSQARCERLEPSRSLWYGRAMSREVRESVPFVTYRKTALYIPQRKARYHRLMRSITHTHTAVQLFPTHIIRAERRQLQTVAMRSTYLKPANTIYPKSTMPQAFSPSQCHKNATRNPTHDLHHPLAASSSSVIVTIL